MILYFFQIKIDDISYMFYNSSIPLDWVHRVRVANDVCLNEIDIIDNFIDSDMLDIVVVS